MHTSVIGKINVSNIMKIEEHDFILESVDDVSHFYNLQLQKVVNKGKANERVTFGDIMYGLTLETAIEFIARYRVNRKSPDSIDMKTYLKELKEERRKIINFINN